MHSVLADADAKLLDRDLQARPNVAGLAADTVVELGHPGERAFTDLNLCK